jgi:integral membrane protein (TIGR01906 family)
VTDRTPASTSSSTLAQRALTSLVIAVATAIVIVTASLLPFLNPVWVGFEQRRTEALAWTRFSDPELTAVTNAILADLVLGPGTFDVGLAGEPVLNERERGHMRDVRTVFLSLWALAAGAAAGLVILWGRAAPAAAHRRRAAYWRAVRGGASSLAIAVIGLGAIAVLAFDVLFEVFHGLLFAGGGYTFDPGTERLVQLFPFRFWQETAIVVGAVIVLVCGAVAFTARRAGDAMVVRHDPADRPDQALGAVAGTAAETEART